MSTRGRKQIRTRAQAQKDSRVEQLAVLVGGTTALLLFLLF